MSAVQNDTVKVVMATVAASGDHSALTMSTTDGITIEFKLDDMAMSILGLTFSSAVQGIKARRDQGLSPTIFDRKAAE